MSKATKTKPAAEPKAEKPLGVFATDQFRQLGYDPAPVGLVQVYRVYKKAKDALAPGRLSSEGFASVVTIYKLLG
jgi:hypothetical protein